MYKIIGADGKEYGPISTDVLRKWLTEGRLNAHTQILAEGATAWQTLGEIPELAAAIPIAAPPVATEFLGGEGGTPLPPDVRERDYDIDLGDCLGRAWALLTGPRMWLVIGGTAIFLLIQAGLAGFAQIPLLGLLFSLASLIIGGPLVGGVYYFMLRCLRGEAAEVGDIFAGFKYRFLQLFLGQIIVTLMVFAGLLPGMVVVGVGAFLVANHQGGSEVAGIVVIAFGALLMLIPLLYLSVSWFFTLPLIMDKRLDFWPAMSLSRAVVGKHWWTVFFLSIVIGIIGFLGILFCCIGAFFTVPLGLAAAMCAYEKVFSWPTNATPSTP